MPVAGLDGSDLPALNDWRRIDDPYGSGRSAFVVSWDEDDAIHLASLLSEAGWIVALEHADGNRAWKRIKEGKPKTSHSGSIRRSRNSVKQRTNAVASSFEWHGDLAALFSWWRTHPSE